MNRTDAPQCFIRSKRFLRATGSKPTVGSSKYAKLGEVSNVKAEDNFRLFPPLKIAGNL